MRIIPIFLLTGCSFLSFSLLQAQNLQWRLATSPSIDASFTGISMLPDGMTGWAVGNSKNNTGKIYHTKDGFKTWVDQTTQEMADLQFNDVDFVDKLHGWIVGVAGNILYTADGGSNWEKQGERITCNDLVKICAVDSNHVWAVGENGTIISTSDGKNWQSVKINTTSSLYGIDMFDIHHGIVVGKAETIFYTVDGITWVVADDVPQIQGKDFNAVCMVAENTAWLVGDGFTGNQPLKSVFAKTIDGGRTWSLWELANPIMENMWAIDFTSPTRGVVVGDRGWIFVTTDGNTWTPLTRGFANKTQAVAIREDKIWAVGGSGTINYSEDFGANWKVLTDIMGHNLFRICAIGDDHVIAVGYANSMLKTEDAGATWQSGFVIADNEVSSQLWGLDFATLKIGWVSGTDGFIAKTVDGGKTWQLQGKNVTKAWLRSIYAYDEKIVWAVGDQGTILKTGDGGENWTIQSAGITSQALYGIDGLDSNRLVIVGAKSTLLFSTDGGLSWHKANHNLTSEKKLSGIDLVDETHAWAVGQSGTLLFSSNSGVDWTVQNSPIANNLDGVCFKDSSRGWVVGENGIILETIDNGFRWTLVGQGLCNQNFKSITRTENGNIFVCGYNGTIVQFVPTPEDPTIAVADKTLICQFKLSPNFPNPFNNTTVFNYELSGACRVNISIYNAIGQMVANLIDECLPAGVYQLRWDSGNLTSGVYFVKMSAKEFSIVNKLLLLK